MASNSRPHCSRSERRAVDSRKYTGGSIGRNQNQDEKKRGRSRVKDLETSFDEGVTSRESKHTRNNVIYSLQIAQLTF
ncbi:hypothetical protein QFZ94_005677 [Paraburkholderia sp. JPY465]